MIRKKYLLIKNLEKDDNLIEYSHSDVLDFQSLFAHQFTCSQLVSYPVFFEYCLLTSCCKGTANPDICHQVHRVQYLYYVTSSIIRC